MVSTKVFISRLPVYQDINLALIDVTKANKHYVLA